MWNHWKQPPLPHHPWISTYYPKKWQPLPQSFTFTDHLILDAQIPNLMNLFYHCMPWATVWFSVNINRIFHWIQTTVSKIIHSELPYIPAYLWHATHSLGWSQLSVGVLGCKQQKPILVDLTKKVKGIESIPDISQNWHEEWGKQAQNIDRNQGFAFKCAQMIAENKLKKKITNNKYCE